MGKGSGGTWISGDKRLLEQPRGQRRPFFTLLSPATVGTWNLPARTDQPTCPSP